MATVESWYLKFQKSLLLRLPRADWPEVGSEFWDEFRHSLIRHGATEGDARGALSLLVEDPPKFVGELVPGFKKALQAVWKRSEVEDGRPVGGTFAEASAASRYCQNCDGGGQVVVFHQMVCRSVAAYCECAAGKWLYATRSKDLPPDRRLVRLLDVTTDGTCFSLEQPPLESLTDPFGTPLPEVWAKNNPPLSSGAGGGRKLPSGLGQLVPVVPISPKPASAPDPAEVVCSPAPPF
jgi:hypothetical protein